MSLKKYLLYISKNYSFINLRALQKVIQANGDEARWYVDGADVNTAYFKSDEVVINTIADVNRWSPDVVLVPGNYVPNYIKGLKVAIFHGFNVQKRSDEKGHFNIRGCFDLYCTQGPNTTLPFQQLAQKHGYFSVKETGWAALDELYVSSAQSILSNEPQSKVDSRADKPTILLCSTFTTQLSCAVNVFETVKRLSEKGKWQWLVQFHPKMDPAIVERYKSIQSKYLTFVETDNVIPYLHQADAMLCDTSSVISMFLLLHKPVVTFKNAAPKPYFIDIDSCEKIEESLALALSRPDPLMAHIDNFIKETHPYADGRSAHRILAAVNERLSGLHKPNRSKPLSLVREFKQRIKDKYWYF